MKNQPLELLPNGIELATPGLSYDKLQAINTQFPTTIRDIVDLHNYMRPEHRTEAIIITACKIGITSFHNSYACLARLI